MTGAHPSDLIPEQLRERWLLGFDPATLDVVDVDVLVVGSGIAGLTAALLASSSRKVALVTKSRLSDSNTWLAQGGIAGAVGEADSVELHLADTLVVGQGLCDEAVVRAVVAEAPDALADLRRLGMAFDTEDGGAVALALEGGHSLPRVLHSGDSTGAAIQRVLTAALAESDQVSVFEQRFLLDLLTVDGRCTGAVVMDAVTGKLEIFRAGAVVLATGGTGQLFRVTTNPLIATGDGVAAAWRAGADISDLEFVQFHPTALDHEAVPRFLVSEALRGDGAYLLDCDHVRFMTDVHPLAELAPRDVVSREIERVMVRCGRSNVWLDARHLGETYLKSRFPLIWETCAQAGYDLSRDLLPVAPAAHYMVGGVRVDVDGRSSLPGLYATGEVAASGLHGANRLASNSLLEGLVFSRRIVRHLETLSPAEQTRAIQPACTGWSEGDASADAMRSELQGCGSAHLGMGRTAGGLKAHLARLRDLASTPLSADAAGAQARNLLTISALMAAAALAREESRGCHSRLDFPERDDETWRAHTVFSRVADPRVVAVGHPQSHEGA